MVLFLTLTERLKVITSLSIVLCYNVWQYSGYFISFYVWIEGWIFMEWQATQIRV